MSEMNEALVKDHDADAEQLEYALRRHVPGLDWHVLRASEKVQFAKRKGENPHPELMELMIMYRWVKPNYKGRLVLERVVADNAHLPVWLMVWQQVRYALKAQGDEVKPRLWGREGESDNTKRESRKGVATRSIPRAWKGGSVAVRRTADN